MKDGAAAATLLRNADAALYRANEEGRECARFFVPEMNRRVVKFLALEQRIGQSIGPWLAAFPEFRHLALHCARATVAQWCMPGVTAHRDKRADGECGDCRAAL